MMAGWRPSVTAEQREWVTRAVAGDKDALAELLEAFGPEIQAGLTISPTWRSLLDSADVMQVTYLEAFRQIRLFKGKSPEALLGWLRRMAENNLRDAIRGLEALRNPSPRNRVDAYSGDSSLALLDVLTAGVGTPSRAARGAEAGKRLRDALCLLPEDYARTGQLYDLEERPVEEVAVALGRSTGAVFMLRMRAHDRLRELLGSASQILESRS
jgi:RNA polymerase sigma-70 factor (ECF subfamily)